MIFRANIILIRTGIPKKKHRVVFRYTLQQLSTLIETLSHEAITQQSVSAENALVKSECIFLTDLDFFQTLLHYRLSKIMELGHVQLLGKTQAVLCFLKGNHFDSQEIIRRGFYDKRHHAFLQELFKKAEKRRTGKVSFIFEKHVKN